jgi:hypothetical protein
VAALRKTWLRFVKELQWRRILVKLCAYGGGAIGTKIFILISLRQDKEQFFSDGNRSLTSRAIQGCCLKFLEACFLHVRNYKKKKSNPQPFSFSGGVKPPPLPLKGDGASSRLVRGPPIEGVRASFVLQAQACV